MSELPNIECLPERRRISIQVGVVDGQQRIIDCHVGSLTDEASLRLARTYKLAAVQQGKLAPFFGEKLIVPEHRPEVAKVQDELLAGPREARRKFKEKLDENGAANAESVQCLTNKIAPTLLLTDPDFGFERAMLDHL